MMINFHRPILFLLLTLFFICSPFKPDPKEEDKDQPGYAAQLSKIFSGSLFDYFQNHNQALDIIEALTEDGLLKKEPAILIHFDSHSDMYRISKSEFEFSNYGQNSADYINGLILGGKIDEIYWVLPDVTRTPENLEMYWNPDIDATDEYHVMFYGPKTLTFYEDKQDKDILFALPDDYSVNPTRYRTITFHKVILKELQLERNDRPVIVDIDADYFSNNGFDTANEMVVTFNENYITHFLTTLENLGIRPMLTMGALSPDYTNQEDRITLERFFQDIGASTLLGDYLIGYKHHDFHGDTISGSNIRRQSKYLYQGVYEMSYIDLRTNTPDYTTPINDTSVEYKKVNKKIQFLFGISEEKAAAFLSSWDIEDGFQDSIVDYRTIEQNIQGLNVYPLVSDVNASSPSPYRASLKKCASPNHRAEPR